MTSEKKSAIKLNKFWKHVGDIELKPDARKAKMYVLKEKFWKMLYE